MSTIIPEPPPEPTYLAQLTLPAGIDETRLAIVDDSGVIAETVWRPADQYQPGPANWDYQLHLLHYTCTSPWQPEPLGFGCEVERVIRGEASDA